MRSVLHKYSAIAVLLVLLVLVGVVPLVAQDGTIKIHVAPREAYTFVDGHPMGMGNRTIAVNPGEHKVELRNYGYKPEIRTVSVSSGATTPLDVTLEKTPDIVSGPWGAITIEGAGHDAILLNGRTPEYFVGHGDEFNHEWWWKQELVVPPGTHQLAVMRDGKEIWSGSVQVGANERVVVDIPKGVRKTVPWSRGESLSSVSRFKAGTASATAAIARPKAQLAAQTSEIKCGESAQLNWTSSDAPNVEITGVGSVGASGQQSVQPKQTTTYELRASGPGGIASSSATVNLDNSIGAQLALSQAEVRYRRVGDKVVEPANASLNWTVSNANDVSITSIGVVDANGTRTIPVSPQKTVAGAVDETITYTLTATNGCGGLETKTATLRISGSIESDKLALRSIYFPTNSPAAQSIKSGLLASQQESLKAIADAFKQHLAINKNARLVLGGHADRRGTIPYNQSLSERRAQAVEDFLVEQGVPAANIEIRAYGEERNLKQGEIKALIDENPDMSEPTRQQATDNMAALVLAHNRRVDISLTSTGEESAQHYPFKAGDYAVLVDRREAGR